MLKRSSSSSSLRLLWTHAHTKGGERFLSAIQPRSSSSSSRRPFFAEEREEQRKERDAPDYTRERERNDPFEPDDDVNDAKISLTFFLSSSRVSLSKHARLYTLLGPRTRTKKKPILSLVFSSFLKRVVVVSSGVTKSSTAARQKARTKNALREITPNKSSSSSSSSSSFWREKKK